MGRAFGFLVAAYFLAMAVAVTYPGYVPANRIRPLVLGMPFTLAWQVFWIAGAIAILGAYFIWEKKVQAGTDDSHENRRRPPGGER